MEARLWHRFYDEGVPPSLSYDDLSLGELLRRAVAQHGPRDAVCFANRRIRYAELGDHVDRLATALAGFGVGPGVSVAVHLPNLPQTVIAAFAIWVCGGRVVMTNPLYTESEIEHQWTDAGCEVVITADFLLATTLAHLRGELPVRHWVVASIPEYLGWPLRWLAGVKLRRTDPPRVVPFREGADVHAFGRLVARTRSDPPRLAIDPGEPAALQYTGGTTGVSKGAVLSHRNLACNAQQVQAWLGPLVREPQVVLAALPFFHVFGLSISMLLSVRMGSTIVVAPDPRDVVGIMKLVEKHRVSVLPAVPAMLDAMSARAAAGGHDLSSVAGVFSGSAPLTEDTRRRFEQLTGAVVFEGFGLTETSPVTHCNPVRGQRKTATVGLPVPDTDVRLVDPDDATREMAQGEAGELLLKGPQVMSGYWKRPDETAAVLHDGWLSTGDLAVMDEQGYFRIVGRKKDMILCSGYNVYPDEIDRVLAEHPKVAEACTIGVPDPKRGETVKSFVVPVPGVTLEVAELDAHCREHLAAYKVPREYELRSELPKSAVLKLLRRELRDQELAKRARNA